MPRLGIEKNVGVLAGIVFCVATEERGISSYVKLRVVHMYTLTFYLRGRD